MFPFVYGASHDFERGESPYNWYNSCENRLEWEVDATIDAYVVRTGEGIDYMEGNGAMMFRWLEDRGTGYSGVARLKIPHLFSDGRDKTEKYLGFYWNIERYDLGNPAGNNTQVEFKILHENGHRHGFYTWCMTGQAITRGWQHILTGSSTGTQYQWAYYWYWWEFYGVENASETGSYFVKQQDDGHGFTNVQGKGNYSYFAIEFHDSGGGETVEVIIDYIRLSDVEWEYPPTVPPPEEEETYKEPPIEEWIPIGMGFTGLGLIVFTPLLLVIMIKRKKAWHWIPWLFLMIPIGIACVIGWLWG